jgi:hypothetical protein
MDVLVDQTKKRWMACVKEGTIEERREWKKKLAVSTLLSEIRKQ